MIHQRISADKAFEKARHFCRYRERCHAEVKQKLYALGFHKNGVEETIARLIEENYLNEERYAKQYASGKFRINHWGRIKIRAGLKLKKISDYCIKNALESIPEEEYTKTLERLGWKKWKSLPTDHVAFKKHRLKTYLLQKGFEQSLINDLCLSIEGTPQVGEK